MSESSPIGRVAPRPRYLSIAQTAFQQSIAYRVTAMFTVLITFIWIFIIFALWSAAYSGRDQIAGFTFQDMKTYILLAFAINALAGWRVGGQMGSRIRDGSVVIDMIRPLNYRTTQLAMATGMSVLEGMFSFGFAIGIGLLFFDMAGPASPLHLVLFAVSVAVGFITKTMIVFLFSLAIFWTLQGVGIAWARDAVIQVLAGTLIPLALMPDWLRIPAEILPLRGIISTPVTIYLGKADGLGLAGLLLLQVAWLAVLWWGADRLWNRAFRAVDIQGG